MNVVLEAVIIAQIVGLLLVARGFWAMQARESDELLHHLGRGFVVLCLAMALRALWWDGLPIMLTPERWQTIYSATGGRAVPNITFAVIVLYAVRHLLWAIWLLIPETDRRQWHLLTAPFYPRLRGMIVRRKGDK